MRRVYHSSERIAVMFLLVIYLSSSVNAQVDAFSLNAGQLQASICPSTTTLFITEIINTGSTESQYTVNIAGSASKWALSVPTGFVLKPGEKKNVYSYVTPRSTSQPGSYNLDVSVSTSNGDVKKVGYAINVRDCYGVEVKSEQSKQICPCELVKYDFIVRNTGEFQETYNLEVKGSAADYVKLSEYRITMPAGSIKTVFAYVQNLCSLGKADFTIIAEGREIASATSSVDVNSCFDYRVTSEKDFIRMCEHTTMTLPITLSNDGSKSNEYALNIDGPAWANLEKTSLVLGSGQSSRINLVLNPGYKDIGSFNVNFKAVSQLGQVEAIKPLNVEVRECNKVNVEIDEASDKICAGISKNYKATVKNTGEIKNEYKIGLQGPEWASIDKKIVTLEGSQSAGLNLAVKPGENEIGKEEIIVEASTSDSAIKSRDKIGIEVISSKDCFKPELDIQEDKLDVALEASATVPITIKNSGVEASSYELAVSGDAAGFSQLNPSSIRLDAGKSDVVYLYVAPVEGVEEGDYKATVTIKTSNSAVLDTEEVNINVLAGDAAAEEESSTVIKEEELNDTAEEGNETGMEDVTGGAVGLGSRIYDYRYYIIIAFLILIGIILMIRMKEKKVSIEQWEKEVESNSAEYGATVGNSNKTLLGWIVAGVAVAILIVLGWIYAGVVRNYIAYIIAGIVILIILLLFIKYRKGMIKFFAEDESVLQDGSQNSGNASEKMSAEKKDVHDKRSMDEQPKTLVNMPAKAEHKDEQKEHFTQKIEAKVQEKEVKPTKTKEKKTSGKTPEKPEHKPGDKKSDEELYY